MLDWLKGKKETCRSDLEQPLNNHNTTNWYHTDNTTLTNKDRKRRNRRRRESLSKDEVGVGERKKKRRKRMEQKLEF